MKVVLSRKGFDSEYGGGPSPIIDGERIVSLPIKYEKETLRRYSDVALGSHNLGSLISSLYPRIRPDDYCHLDPDLRFDSVPRRHHWRPLFGQADQSASHLVEMQIQAGDIFLFFGLFRDSEGWLRFRRAAPKRHVIWGWLQVDEVIHDPVGWSKSNAWAGEHPHTYGNWWTGRNLLFVGKRNLEVDRGGNRRVLDAPGAGVFDRFHERLCLSDPASKSPSHWRLPVSLRPNAVEGKSMSYLEGGAWTNGPNADFVHLNPGYIRKWQEAVITGNSAAADWAINLIRELS